MTTPIVLSLGELLWDMLPGGKRAGGAPVNFAYHAMKNGTEGWAISKDLIEELLKAATVFKINDEELLLLRDMFDIRGTSGEDASRWFLDEFDLDYVILTAGSAYSTIMSRKGEVSTLDTPHVEVVDTVGAGDSFSGTFTARTLLGDSLADAHRKAVNTAAFVCTQAGAWPEYPAEMPDYLVAAGK